MNRDQRPGRVRMLTTASSAQAPIHRRSDPAARPAREAPGPIATPAAATPDVPAARRAAPMLLTIILFLAGCILGGALIAGLGLFRGQGA